MAWITSATTRMILAIRQRSTPLALLLVAHLAILFGLLQERAVGSPHHLSDMAMIGGLGSTVLALLTGFAVSYLLLADRQPFARANPPYRTAVQVTSQPLPAAETSLDAHCGLMARLHHDLRTPLNAMMGFADLMQAEVFGPLGNERYRSYAAHMQACGHELLKATESTLAMADLLAGPQRPPPNVVAVEALITEAWAASARAAGTAAPHFRCHAPPGLRVRADDTALRHSLVHLLEAAAAKCSSLGTVELSARCYAGRVLVAISTKPQPLAPAMATTGCRPRTSCSGTVDELSISVSRKLLGLQGIPLVVTTDSADAWVVTLSLEDAAQCDLFDDRPSLAGPERQPRAEHTPAYSAAFLPAPSLSLSRST
jgi:signal transduction histidine kinase